MPKAKSADQAAPKVPKKPSDKAAAPEATSKRICKHTGKAGQLMYSPEDVAAKCRDYLDLCDATGRKPTWQGLAGYLDVTAETLTVWYKDGNRDSSSATQAVSLILKKVADALSDRLQQRTDCMAMISVKQPLYGGFIDRPEAGVGGSVNIQVNIGQSDGKVVAEYGK